MRLQHFDLLDRISATQRQQWIAHPFAPGLKAAERPAAFKIMLMLPTVSPDRESGRQQLNAILLDPLEQAGTERAALGIFAARIELAVNEAASKILRYCQPLPVIAMKAVLLSTAIFSWPNTRMRAGRSVITVANVSERSTAPFTLSRNNAGAA